MATDPGETLVIHLKAAGAVTAIVGAGDDARIRPDVLPQNETLPAIRYELLSLDRLRTLDGGAQMFIARFQLDSYADTRKAATGLAGTVVAAIDGHRGTVSGLFWCDAQIDVEFDAIDQPPAGSELWRRRRTVDAQIVYTIPA